MGVLFFRPQMRKPSAAMKANELMIPHMAVGECGRASKSTPPKNGPADQPNDSARPKAPMYRPLLAGGAKSATTDKVVGANNISPNVTTTIAPIRAEYARTQPNRR